MRKLNTIMVTIAKSDLALFQCGCVKETELRARILNSVNLHKLTKKNTLYHPPSQDH